MRNGPYKGDDVKRNLFTPVSVITALLCVGTGVAGIATIRMSIDGEGGPGLTVYTIPWLRWSCAFFALLTFGLLLWRAHRIRQADNRERSGLCPHCGYDLRETPDRCPECGAVPDVWPMGPAEEDDASHPRSHA